MWNHVFQARVTDVCWFDGLELVSDCPSNAITALAESALYLKDSSSAERRLESPQITCEVVHLSIADGLISTPRIQPSSCSQVASADHGQDMTIRFRGLRKGFLDRGRAVGPRIHR
jgi:hypothetical protein